MLSYTYKASKREIKNWRDAFRSKQKLSANVSLERIGLMNPSIGTSNMGDYIIQDAVVYGAVEIPVDIKIVFPTRAYAIKLTKYAAIFAGLYGGFRYLIGMLLGDSQWLVDAPYLTRQSPFAFFLFAGTFRFRQFLRIEMDSKNGRHLI
ncbi:hypothetical protein [Dyadobacter sp. CY261]|uniref:hypothetical protein n=1 Tax=Dyadobacter sp. CY261 TaxID=2907203 RepID=UPI001F265033|nr:hypothetical protein [Dyadobacter sp. CY261]